jgi:HEAT repeat protein
MPVFCPDKKFMLGGPDIFLTILLVSAISGGAIFFLEYMGRFWAGSFLGWVLVPNPPKMLQWELGNPRDSRAFHFFLWAPAVAIIFAMFIAAHVIGLIAFLLGVIIRWKFPRLVTWQLFFANQEEDEEEDYSIQENTVATTSLGSLIETLKNGKAADRKLAAKSLSGIEDNRVIEALIEALGDANVYVRKNSALALGEIQDFRATEPLIVALRDKIAVVREEAAKALGSIKDPRSLEALCKALEDRKLEVRQEAVWALGELQDVRATEPLLKALSGKYEIIRQRAAEVLGKIGDPKAIDALLKALHDQRSIVRLGTKDGLISMGKEAIIPLIDASVSQILSQQDAPDKRPSSGEVRTAFDGLMRNPEMYTLSKFDPELVAEALGMKNPEEAKLLMDALKSDSKITQKEAAETLKSMANSLRNSKTI